MRPRRLLLRSILACDGRRAFQLSLRTVPEDSRDGSETARRAPARGRPNLLPETAFRAPPSCDIGGGRACRRSRGPRRAERRARGPEPRAEESETFRSKA